MKVSKKITIPAVIVSVIIVLAMAAWIGVGLASIAGIATPEYKVLSQHDGYEIREYAPQIVAEVDVEGTFEESLNQGFRKLAGYIFGDNTAPATGAGQGSQPIAMTAPVLEQATTSAPIAMTAPVLEVESGLGARRVTFVMPREYTMETLPKPRDPAVRLVEVPARRYAATTFSGWVDATRAASMKAQVLEYLARDQQKPVGPPSLAQYNPPWTPPFMRKNEILVPLS